MRGDGARVAIAEGCGERVVVGVEADVVDGPAIDGDGADAFGGELGARRRPSSMPATMAVEVQCRPSSISTGPLGKR